MFTLPAAPLSGRTVIRLLSILFSVGSSGPSTTNDFGVPSATAERGPVPA